MEISVWAGSLELDVRMDMSLFTKNSEKRPAKHGQMIVLGHFEISSQQRFPHANTISLKEKR